MTDSIDVKTVKKGIWITEEYENGDPDVGIEPCLFTRRAESGDCAYCSECGSYAGLNEAEEYVLSNFCPNCGADMRGKKGMKVTIEIPLEFVLHYKNDKFKDSLKRCIFDLKNHTATKIERYLAWDYDIEVLEMLVDAFDKVEPFEEKEE